jgi:hypothetical protein
MRILFDTNVLLWAIQSGSPAREALLLATTNKHILTSADCDAKRVARPKILGKPGALVGTTKLGGRCLLLTDLRWNHWPSGVSPIAKRQSIVDLRLGLCQPCIQFISPV